MKLQQLRYLAWIVKNNLNISAAAESLHTSQPGISKQIRLLEDELGVKLFKRNGKYLTYIMPIGERIIKKAENILLEVRNIQVLAEESCNDQMGNLSIATTHTQARYALPDIVKMFREHYPAVTLQLHQGSPTQIAELVLSGEVDFAITTESIELFEDLLMMPCYLWSHCVLVPQTHPLLQIERLSLVDIAQYPLVTYVFGFTGRSPLDMAFRAIKLEPRVVFAATDAEVIKTYVRLGLGIGIIARMAYDPECDRDLVCLDADHLFTHNITRIGFRWGVFLRSYMYHFIKFFAPHLSCNVVEKVEGFCGQREVDEFFEGVSLPLR
jgi:LysR family cys regulon transcriptional activator